MTPWAQVWVVVGGLVLGAAAVKAQTEARSGTQAASDAGSESVTGPATEPEPATQPESVTGPATQPEPVTGPATEPEPVTGPTTEPEPVTGSESEPVSVPGSEPGADAAPPSPPGGGPGRGAPPSASKAAPGSNAIPPRIEVFAGAGLGTRAFERPVATGLQRLETAVFPAAEAGLRVSLWPGERLGLEVGVRYQTSLGLRVTEKPLFALPEEIPTRSERAAVTVAPVLRLTSSPRAPALAAGLGASIRAFVPDERELQTPAYHLAGPHLRLSLIAPLSDRVSLRAGPELQWIVSLGDALTGSGVDTQGLAVGGEALLAVALTDWLSVELTYRQSHAMASHAGDGPDFEDVERFATGRLRGAL